jgi:Alginate export
LNNEQAEFAQGTDDEHRQTLGMRLWGGAGAGDYDFEFAYQFGSFGDANIRAWTAASDTGYTLEGVTWKPRLAIKANVGTGDQDPDDGTLGTFNPLFPKGAYFTEASLNAPANFFDIYPYLELEPAEGFLFTAGWDVLWRYSTDDAFYSQPLTPLVPADASGSPFVGSQATVQAA